MLSTSQRHNSDYSLTARLMGDPRPDRYTFSEALRSRVALPSTPEKRPERQSPVLRLHYVLRAMTQGCTNVKTIAEALGVKHSSAGAYAREVVLRDWATSKIVAVGGKGKMCVFEITDAGRKELKKIEPLL